LTLSSLTFMPKVKVYLCGLLPEEFFFTRELELEEPVTLEGLEREIVKRWGEKISPEYLGAEGGLNHRLVRAGDAQGKRLEYGVELAEVEEVWFVVPFGGG